MKNITLLALVLITMSGCKNNTKNENKTVTKEENTLEEETQKAILDTGCYVYHNKGNIIKMEITEVNKNVKGNLDIAYAEKDANQGKFSGTVKEDKLIINYTFNSEGTESSREMAFLIKGNQLIEGYGELNENGTKFKDKKTIRYNSSMPLTKTECDK